MSNRTSHRRRARQRYAKQAKAGFTAYIQMCAECSREQADRQYGGDLLCGSCRDFAQSFEPAKGAQR